MQNKTWYDKLMLNLGIANYCRFVYPDFVNDKEVAQMFYLRT